MKTAVAMIIFNRPDLTERVFAEIARARPPVLLVSADAPRPDRPGEVEKCAATRAIIERVDWDCVVLKNYAETNLGHMRGPLSAIEWVFEQVEEAIILEDDCLPQPSFFEFCDELLERYRDDERVMMISGNNLLLNQRQVPSSYFFCKYGVMWGWATWRRAWRTFDPELSAWPSLRETDWLLDILIEPRAAHYWRAIFDAHYGHGRTPETWDAPWTFALWAQGGLSIAPEVNLISNIGFRQDASHTVTTNRLAELPTAPIGFPLRHPPAMVRDREAEQTMLRHVLPESVFAERPGLYRRLRRQALTLIPAPLRRQILQLHTRH
jgi:hypothetical protein